MTLQAVLESVSLDQIGASHGKYLNFDAKNEKWSVVSLNCLERFIRWLGLAYGSTTLKHIATQIEKENVIDTSVLLAIQASWDRAYPAVRSPLKAKPYTVVGSEGGDLNGRLLGEQVVVGESYFVLCQNHQYLDREVADDQKIEIPLRNVSTKEDVVQAIRQKLEEESSGLDEDGNEILCDVFFKCALDLELGVIQKWMGEVLSTLETFLHEKDKAGIDQYCGILFEDSEDGAKQMAETIKICREMKHPHGRML